MPEKIATNTRGYPSEAFKWFFDCIETVYCAV